MSVEPQDDRTRPPVQRRPPQEVMRLARLGCFHQSRLSFMRVLLRRLRNDGWQFDRPRWLVDGNGVGSACYRAIGPERTYTLVCFGHDLPAHQRSDRVIAQAWDATFTLFDGEPAEADMQRLAQQVPLQEAGRVSERELVLSRANRSVRLFEHVVDALAYGRQPDAAQLRAVGYLMRTTAVYASGKFGVADRDVWKDRPEFCGSFQPELLAVWLIRAFTLDVVEHLARVRAPIKAVAMHPGLRRQLGVGNATGLGMAPFLITHPSLLHSWIAAREDALLRVRAQADADAAVRAHFKEALDAALRNVEFWHTEHPLQVAKVKSLGADLVQILKQVDAQVLTESHPWERLYAWSQTALSEEGQEQLVSLMLEPYAELVDPLAQTMAADEAVVFPIDGSMPIAQLRAILEQNYDWALSVDYASRAAIARVWYVSQEKLEPRLGERFEEPIEPYEQPLAPGRDASALYRALCAWPDSSDRAGARSDADLLAAFLAHHPEHRHMARRAQLALTHEYAEIRDNTIDAGMLPIDMLRCKLSFFGATRFDPRSDRWIRITLYQGAPFPHELAGTDPDRIAVQDIGASV